MNLSLTVNGGFCVAHMFQTVLYAFDAVQWLCEAGSMLCGDGVVMEGRAKMSAWVNIRLEYHQQCALLRCKPQTASVWQPCQMAKYGQHDHSRAKQLLLA